MAKPHTHSHWHTEWESEQRERAKKSIWRKGFFRLNHLPVSRIEHYFISLGIFDVCRRRRQPMAIVLVLASIENDIPNKRTRYGVAIKMKKVKWCFWKSSIRTDEIAGCIEWRKEISSSSAEIEVHVHEKDMEKTIATLSLNYEVCFTKNRSELAKNTIFTVAACHEFLQQRDRKSSKRKRRQWENWKGFSFIHNWSVFLYQIHACFLCVSSASALAISLLTLLFSVHAVTITILSTITCRASTITSKDRAKEKTRKNAKKFHNIFSIFTDNICWGFHV